MFVNQQAEAVGGVAFIAVGALVYWLFLRRSSSPAGNVL
jgi:hypothetical protein